MNNMPRKRYLKPPKDSIRTGMQMRIRGKVTIPKKIPRLPSADRIEQQRDSITINSSKRRSNRILQNNWNAHQTLHLYKTIDTSSIFFSHLNSLNLYSLLLPFHQLITSSEPRYFDDLSSPNSILLIKVLPSNKPGYTKKTKYKLT